MSRAADRTHLIELLRAAVDAESRWGKFVPVLPEITERWEKVVSAIEKLCAKQKK